MTTITIKGKDYRCKISARACVELEKKLRDNPLNVFLQVEQHKFPTLGQLLMIFQASLTEFNHGISEDDVFKIYDDYCEEGGDYTKFMTDVITPILTDSGIIPNEDESEEVEPESKNLF